MASDTDARNTVRQLMQRFDAINCQRLGLAYVLSKRNPVEYAQLLDAAEAAIPSVIRPIADADALHVYAALGDHNADWCKAVLEMLSQGPINIAKDKIGIHA